MNVIMEKLWLEGKKFVTREELRKILKGKSYSSTVGYLLSRGYLARIFKGVFYVKSLEEKKLGKAGEFFFEILSNGLMFKGVKNWYFGLETALKLNKLTHEYFVVETVINDKIFRPKPIRIMNHKIKFVKMKSEMIFGLKEENGIKFSDIEKTMLDFIYLAKYSSFEEREIYNKISDLVNHCSEEKLKEYAKKYPKSIGRFLIKWKIVKNL